MPSQFPPASPAPVERRHRLAVLRVQGFTDEWLAEHNQHWAHHWLEGNHMPDWSSSSYGRVDNYAQEMANMEALGRGESVSYREALHRIVDRLDRLIDQEFGVEPKKLHPLPFSKGLVGAINDVFAFHDATEVPCLDSPQWPGDERAYHRWSLVREEFEEFRTALNLNDDGQPRELEGQARVQLCDIADSLVDQIYVLVGTALEFGIPLDRVWNEVQRANMSKVGPDGVRKRADGKVLKPEGWTPPDIEKAVFGPRFEQVQGTSGQSFVFVEATLPELSPEALAKAGQQP